MRSIALPLERPYLGRILEALGADGCVTIASIAGVATLGVALGGPLALGAGGLAPFVVAFALLALTALAKVAWVRPPRRHLARELVRHGWIAGRVWAPFVTLYVYYRGLRPVVEAVVVADLGPTARALDEAILGVSPAWWMQDLASPWLTDLMAYAYGLMFVFPIALFVLLYGRDQLRALGEVVLPLLVAFYIGLALYLLIPVRSPRLVYDFAVELRGAVGLYELSTGWWDHATRVTHDAFPSLHTAISAICLWAAHRHGALALPGRPRLLFRLYLPHVVLLWIATMYLRQHYFVDVVAGLGLAIAAVWLARRIQRGWAQLVRSAGGRAPR